MSAGFEFISMSSGSSGNCYYFESDGLAFLIDAGVGGRTLKKRLAEYGKSIENIRFILVTHNHIDHIRHLGSIADRYSIPVYTSEIVHNSLLSNICTVGRIIPHRRVLEKESTFELFGIKITCFDVPHDSDENLGYFIETGSSNITVVTDIGRVTESLITYCKKSRNVIIESNYDHNMLENGRYPVYLINRIKGGNGHLSNEETAQAIKTFYHSELRNIFLCHLSLNNNTPELAFKSSLKSLNELGVKVGEELNLHCLPRRDHKRFVF